VGRVADRLRAGAITVDQAVEELIDDAVTRQVGAATQGRAELEERLRELLRQYAATDPQLTAHIRRLTLRK
jgi:molybdenum-dependent DNA-binding transcriptional regulator ModE